MKDSKDRLIANNKKVFHDYFIEEAFEAGIELVGTEVKSLRQGNCSIKEAFIGVDNGEIFIHHLHINTGENVNIYTSDQLTK